MQTEAATLNREGIVELGRGIDAGLLQELSAYAHERLGQADAAQAQQRLGHKRFWTRLSDIDSPDGVFDSNHPLVKFALQPGVLGMVTAALGELPQLSEVLLTVSRESDEPESYSQLWHRDHDDPRTIKVFAYLTDVLTHEAGPFTCVAGPASDRHRYALRSHLPDAEFFSRFERSDVREILGPKNSVFSVETSRCWHMGSRIRKGPSRLLYTANFIRYPRIYGEPPPRFRLVGNGSEATRLALFAE